MEITKSAEIHVMAQGILLASPFFSGGDAPYHATSEQRRIEIEIGEVVSFGCAGWLTFAWSLLRRPEGSSAVLANATLYGVDRPGLYVVRCQASGRWVRELELCAFTRTQMYGEKNRLEEIRLQSRGWLNDPGRTTEQVINRLEK